MRAARAAHDAAIAHADDAAFQWEAEVRRLRDRAAGLAAIAADCRRTLAEYGGGEVQRKALDAGEISLADYLAETAMRYDAAARALEAERDTALALTALATLISAEM